MNFQSISLEEWGFSPEGQAADGCGRRTYVFPGVFDPVRR